MRFVSALVFLCVYACACECALGCACLDPILFRHVADWLPCAERVGSTIQRFRNNRKTRYLIIVIIQKLVIIRGGSNNNIQVLIMTFKGLIPKVLNVRGAF